MDICKDIFMNLFVEPGIKKKRCHSNLEEQVCTFSKKTEYCTTIKIEPKVAFKVANVVVLFIFSSKGSS